MPSACGHSWEMILATSNVASAPSISTFGRIGGAEECTLMPTGGWRWAKVSLMPAPHHLMMISMRPLSVGIPPPTEAKGGRCRRPLRRMRQWPHSVKNRPSEVRPQCLRGGPCCHSHCRLCRFLFALAIVVNLAQNPMMPPPPLPLAFLPDLLSLHCSIVKKSWRPIP